MHWAHCLLAPLLLVTAVTATRSFGHNGPWDPRLRIPGHKRPSYEMPHIADPDLPADGFEMHDGITRKHWYAIRAGYAAERTFELWELYDKNPTSPPSPEEVAQSKQKLGRWLEGEIEVLKRRAAIKEEIAAEHAKLDELEEEGRGSPATAKARSQRATAIRARLQQLEEQLAATFHPRRTRRERRQRWNKAGWRPFDWGVGKPYDGKDDADETKEPRDPEAGSGTRQRKGVDGSSMADQGASLARDAQGYFKSMLEFGEDAVREVPKAAQKYLKLSLPPSSARVERPWGRYMPKGRP